MIEVLTHGKIKAVIKKTQAANASIEIVTIPVKKCRYNQKEVVVDKVGWIASGCNMEGCSHLGGYGETKNINNSKVRIKGHLVVAEGATGTCNGKFLDSSEFKIVDCECLVKLVRA